MPSISGTAKGASTLDTRAQPGRRLLLVFERGHWCATCRRHLSLLAEQIDEFAQRGIDVLAVTHESANELIGRVYPFSVIADPDLIIGWQLDLVHFDEDGKETMRPSVVIVEPDGTILFSYVGDDSRDRPTIPALFLGIERL